MMNGPKKSDTGIVAEKPANKAVRAAAELAEPRPVTNGNSRGLSTDRTQCRSSVYQAAERIRRSSGPRSLPEVGAVCVSAHVRICAGGAGQPASLPRNHPLRSPVGRYDVYENPFDICPDACNTALLFRTPQCSLVCEHKGSSGCEHARSKTCRADPLSVTVVHGQRVVGGGRRMPEIADGSISQYICANNARYRSCAVRGQLSGKLSWYGTSHARCGRVDGP